MARELGPFGIRVNSILPGPLNGDRMRRVIAAKAIATGRPEAALWEEAVRYSAMRRMVDHSDVAAMALFLSSGSASVVTGQEIAVDGLVEWED
jgi:NAD(P)-dependent dehydrogenase (short-subunit alcohol dehydrogenase family)